MTFSTNRKPSNALKAFDDKKIKTMRIIPAIDLIDGKCVRLSQGDYDRMKIYNSNPLDVAKEFEDHGIRHLHLVDLDGAKSQRIVNWKTLEKICNHTSLEVDFGGGIKTDEAIKIAFGCGAKQITGGSIAVKKPEVFSTWLEKYGSEKIILGADAKNEKIAVNGWKETTETDLFSFLKNYTEKGIEYVICTDISKDGMLAGSSVELYQKILEQFPEMKLIASGGVDGIEDLKRLKAAGLEGAIVGKAIYEGRISLRELESFIIE